MRDLREIIATDAAVGLKPPTTEQEAVYLRHALIRCEARMDKIHELLCDWENKQLARGAIEGEDI